MSQLKDYLPRTGPDYLPLAFGRLRTARAKYDFAVDGGLTGTITPKTNETIPKNAIMLGGFANPTTALLATGEAANVSVGVVNDTATTLMAATAKASFSLNALLALIPTFAVPVKKTTTAGKITITPDTNALTAGVLEIVVYYILVQG